MAMKEEVICHTCNRPLKYDKVEMKCLSCGVWISNWNAYRCEDCGVITYSVDFNEGATQCMIRCTRCGGKADTFFYRLKERFGWADVPHDAPLIEWYRPNWLRRQLLTGARFRYVKNGGLDFRLVKL